MLSKKEGYVDWYTDVLNQADLVRPYTRKKYKLLEENVGENKNKTSP